MSKIAKSNFAPLYHNNSELASLKLETIKKKLEITGRKSGTHYTR